MTFLAGARAAAFGRVYASSLVSYILQRSEFRYIYTVVCKGGLSIDVKKTNVQAKFLKMESSFCSSNDLTYEDLLELKKKDNVVLIDVREDNEIQETGELPGSIHIPLNEVKNALESTSPEDFENKYGIKKPTTETSICFSCRSGRRSKIAMDIALGLGFHNSCHYAGGFLDWQNHCSP